MILFTSVIILNAFYLYSLNGGNRHMADWMNYFDKSFERIEAE